MKQAPLVLIVEDESALVTLLRYNLEREGFRVAEARDGEEAMLQIAEQMPDLVLLDWMLPLMSGIEVCRQLRRLPETRRLPIVMLTARGEEGDKLRGLDAGADDYVTKPFAIEELLARLRAHLRRGNPSQEVLRVADLTLEPAARAATRAGAEISLTPQEFSLLELLMRHPRQVMTRQRILDHVWGYDATPASNVVDIYIHYLRDKVDRGHERKLIHTVRSFGYVLKP